MKETTDVWFMAFLMLNNINAKNYNKNNLLIKSEYELTDKEWIELKNKYINSEIYKVKFFIRSLKEMGK